MVNFVKSFRPISGLVWIVCVAEDEVNDGQKGMETGSTRDCILTRIIILGDVVEETLDTGSASQDEPFKGFGEKLCEGEISEATI